MTTLDNLGSHVDGSLIAESQSQKELTSNGLDNLLSNATQRPLSLAISDDAGSPTSADLTLTDDEFFGHLLFRLSGSPSIPFQVIVPATGNHLFVVENATGKTATFTTGSGVTSNVDDTATTILHSDGTDIRKIAGGLGDSVSGIDDLTDVDISSSPPVANDILAWDGTGDWVPQTPPYEVGVFLAGKPGDAQLVLKFVFASAVDFPSGLTASQGHLGVAADAQSDFDIQKNGSSVGTCRFAASSTTASFIMASAQSFALGDRLEIVAPATADATAADVSITLRGSRG